MHTPHKATSTASFTGIDEWSLEEARAERDAVLHALRHDAEGLRARAESDGLAGWEWCLLAELDELDALEQRLCG